MTKAQSNLKTKRRRRRTLGGRSRQRLGTDRPRLSVHRTLKHISAQVINDDEGKTLAWSSTRVVDSDVAGTKSEKAKSVGLKLGAMCKENNISAVVFDRNGYRYHGRVKALADGAREAGLQF